MISVQKPQLVPGDASPVRVLVVDDSAFMRLTISSHLNQHPGIQIVGSARNGEEALAMLPKLNPDVITLDVEMPQMDGLTTLQRIMSTSPRPVLMLSSLTTEGAAETIRALTLGAVDFVQKPAQKANIQAVMEDVARKILAAAGAKVWHAPAQAPQPVLAPAAPHEKTVRSWSTKSPVVLIGASTGGPRALNMVIPQLPADLPAAVVVVQHMPAGFTRSLAERLNATSPLYVKEAEPGEMLQTGKVLLAPGGFHLTFNESGQAVMNQTPTVHGVRPAVDVTLTSLVQRYQRRVISVILTGMGKDGTNGSMLLHAQGGRVITEDESSCVVWGMPRSVVEAGASDISAPIHKIPALIVQAVQSFQPV